jgi:adenine-specific DNA-methyltransferase
MDDTKKNKGVYYTPTELANFIINYIFKEYRFDDKINILEPSCGDGVFINSLINCGILKNSKDIDISLVEINQSELSKIQVIVNKLQSEFNMSFINEDYLEFQTNNSNKYDLIVGNPPYINKRLMSQNQITLSNGILEKAGILPANIKNIWTSFLVSAVTALEEDGVVCFVLPSELMQVKHSEPIREYLRNVFNCIELFTFNELIFDDIEQDTIVFIGSNQKHKKGVYYHNFDSLNDVVTGTYSTITYNEIDNLDYKWTALFLNKDQYEQIVRMKSNINSLNDYCSSSAGIVTAANSHFIVNNQVVEKYKLEAFVRPIIKKSSFIQNLITFEADDMVPLMNSNIPTNLLVLDSKIDDFNDEVKSYLNILIEDKIPDRYKCAQRDKWYLVPSIWESEGFFFKRSYHYPKLIINNANILVTDTAYRITMKDNYNINSLTFSFYNSLTLVFAELYGRFYGGGVLELTPNEFKQLPLPYISIDNKHIEILDRMFREEMPIDQILNFTNKLILIDGLGFSGSDINVLNDARERLVNRRLKL